MRHIFLALIALAYAAVAYLSPLPWDARSVPQVAPVAVLPSDIGQAKVMRVMDQGVLLPHAPDPAIAAGAPVRVGFSYRLVSIAKVPVYAYRELGLALVRDTSTDTMIVPLNEDVRAELGEQPGGALDIAYDFPAWRFMWGGLFVPALLIWYLFQRRAESRRRDALGLI